MATRNYNHRFNRIKHIGNLRTVFFYNVKANFTQNSLKHYLGLNANFLLLVIIKFRKLTCSTSLSIIFTRILLST